MGRESEIISQINQLLNELADIAIKTREILVGINLDELKAKAATYDELKKLIG